MCITTNQCSSSGGYFVGFISKFQIVLSALHSREFSQHSISEWHFGLFFPRRASTYTLIMLYYDSIKEIDRVDVCSRELFGCIPPPPPGRRYLSVGCDVWPRATNLTHT